VPPHRHDLAADAALSVVPATKPGRLSSPRLVVPDTIGLNALEAHRLLRAQRLAIAISVWETKIGPWGLVLSQDPEPGSLVAAGSNVTVVVAGRPHLTVPDVRGLPHTVAADILRRAGLSPDVSSERGSRSVARGEVIATLPRVGSLVTDGTRITLEVSRGRPAADRASDDPQVPGTG
jgi:eukaryotic-like serine/threonine-protein kinase